MILQKLADVRVRVQEQVKTKSGHNKFSNYDYFELSDFLPIANRELAKEGLLAVFSIVYSDAGIEIATMDILTGEGEKNEGVKFQAPTAECNIKGASPIQNQGGKFTYMRRYLWLMALELTDADVVDQQPNENKESESKQMLATPNQIKMIEGASDIMDINALLEKFNVSEIKKLTIKQASDICARIKEAREAKNGNSSN